MALYIGFRLFVSFYFRGSVVSLRLCTFFSYIFHFILFSMESWRWNESTTVLSMVHRLKWTPYTRRERENKIHNPFVRFPCDSLLVAISIKLYTFISKFFFPRSFVWMRLAWLWGGQTQFGRLPITSSQTGRFTLYLLYNLLSSVVGGQWWHDGILELLLQVSIIDFCSFSSFRVVHSAFGTQIYGNIVGLCQRRA